VDRASPLDLAGFAARREITRLCHLTPLRNLVHLASDDAGLLSLRQLVERSGDYDQQDLERLDAHPDHICCSIEYPNAWYLARRKLQATPIQRLFPDWVCLAIDPKYLWAPGTRVCVRNAAAAGGAFINDISLNTLEALYASPISGAHGHLYSRTPERVAGCPTDDQAEVLVHRAIRFADVHTVIGVNLSDVKRFYVALEQVGADVDRLQWAVAPTLFDARVLSAAIAAGKPPLEAQWDPR